MIETNGQKVYGYRDVKNDFRDTVDSLAVAILDRDAKIYGMLDTLQAVRQWMIDSCIDIQQRGLPSREAYESVVSAIA